MTSNQFEEMKDSLDCANPGEDSVILAILADDVNITIHEGSKQPEIDHEKFLSFYLKFLKDQHDLDPQMVTQRAIQDLQNRIE